MPRSLAWSPVSPHRPHLWVGEGDSWHDVGARAIGDLVAEDDVGGDAGLVLAHVGEHRPTIAVADRVQPIPCDADRLQLVVDLYWLTWGQPDGVKPESRSGRAATGGDRELVADIAIVGRLDRDKSVCTVTPNALDLCAGYDRDALRLEGCAYLVAGEWFLTAQ
jgi:hypothetical protein